MLKDSLQATMTRQLGYLLSRNAFLDFKKRLDYSEYGGAPLLGVRGVCIVGHGSSDGHAIKNAVRVAAETASRGINSTIEQEIAHPAHAKRRGFFNF
jgi:glycerol-3-phosphate acyltransferase PlsX